MGRLGVVLAIVRRDLQLFLHDRRGLVMSFAAPIAIGSFFGFLFSGDQGRERARIPVLVVDADGSAVSQAVREGLARDPALEVKDALEPEAREAVRRGRATVAVLLPAGFGEAAADALVGAGKKPEVALLHDPSHAAEVGMVRGLLTQHVMEATSSALFSGAGGSQSAERALARLRQDHALPEAERRALSDMLEGVQRYYARPRPSPAPGAAPRPGGLSLPYAVAETPVTARAGVPYNGFAHSFAGMGVQFLFFACIDLAVGMLQERRQGLWLRLRAAPLGRSTFLLGKLTSGALISLLVLAVTFAFAIIVWKVRILGSLTGFLLVAAGTALMASAFGLLMASLGRTPEATRGLAIVAVLLLVMLGGAWVPAFVFPAWLQRFTLAVPARWAVDGLDGATWRGLGLLALLPTAAVLLGFAALFAAVAVARFRWDAE